MGKNSNMENKKQTAVEWLYERLERMIPRTALSNIDKKEFFERAKKIEKEQIVEALLVDFNWKYPMITKYSDMAEKYYQETYGNK